MNPRHILILLGKEIRQGKTNFFFTYALLMPIILSLLVALVFGDLFSETPRLGVYDAGQSAITARLLATEHLEVIAYTNEAALREAVQRGGVMAGVIFPTGFDAALAVGQQPTLTTLYWSESLAKDIAIINSTLDQLTMAATNAPSLIRLNVVQLGEASNISWTERLLPMIVLMAIILGGVLVPAASLVDEKQKRTLSALTITPASLLDVYAAKALLGVGISTLMGLVVLIINNAFGGQPALLVMVLALGAVAASVFGVLLGSFVKDINVLLAVIKAGGLVLFAPALVQLVPDIPQWIAQVFPTYYILNPVLAVSQRNAGLGDIGGELAVLLALIGAMILILVLIFERQQKRLALAI
jgi:ABC-2 type transport system permease protein